MTNWMQVALDEIDALIEATPKKRDREAMSQVQLLVESVALRQEDADLELFRSQGDRWMRE